MNRALPRTLRELIFAKLALSKISLELIRKLGLTSTRINIHEFGLTKDVMGMNSRQLGLIKDFAGINFGLIKDAMGINSR